MSPTPPSSQPLRITHYALRLTHYFRLGRPLFLTGGFLFHALGVAIALFQGEGLNLEAWLWGQMGITAVQVMTHYSNDYFDLAADKANRTPTRWSGGSRILVEGLVSPRAALVTAVLAGITAMTAAVILTFSVHTGPLTIPLYLLAAALAWSYSAPPLRLNMRGRGELAGAVLIPGLTTFVGYYLQSGRLSLLPLLAVFPLSCLQMAMLLVINFPDAEGDAAAGKRTLVHLLGEKSAVRLYLVLLALTYLSLPLLVLGGLPSAVALALLALSPIALWQGWRMGRRAWADPAKWNSLGMWSIGLLILSATAELLAFVYLL
jgi:1,4-dihydroxy-2-naphthoate polyprenyltransferase